VYIICNYNYRLYTHAIPHAALPSRESSMLQRSTGRASACSRTQCQPISVVTYTHRTRVGIVGGWGLNPPPQFMSTDTHFWEKIGFKVQSLGKISNISTADPPLSPSSFRSIPTLHRTIDVRHFCAAVNHHRSCLWLLFSSSSINDRKTKLTSLHTTGTQEIQYSLTEFTCVSNLNSLTWPRNDLNRCCHHLRCTLYDKTEMCRPTLKIYNIIIRIYFNLARLS